MRSLIMFKNTEMKEVEFSFLMNIGRRSLCIEWIVIVDNIEIGNNRGIRRFGLKTSRVEKWHWDRLIFIGTLTLIIEVMVSPDAW